MPLTKKSGFELEQLVARRIYNECKRLEPAQASRALEHVRNALSNEYMRDALAQKTEPAVAPVVPLSYEQMAQHTATCVTAAAGAAHQRFGLLDGADQVLRGAAR